MFDDWPRRTVRKWIASACLLFFASGTPSSGNDIVDFLKNWGDSQGRYDARREQWRDQQSDRYRPQPVEPARPAGVPFLLPVELELSSSECGLEAGHYDFELYGGQRMHLDVNGLGGGGTGFGAGNPTLLLAEARTLKPHVDIVVEAVRNANDRQLQNTGQDAARELDRVIRDLERARMSDAADHYGHHAEDWARFANLLSKYQVGLQLRRHLEAIQHSQNRLTALFRSGGGPGGINRWDYDRPRLFGLSRVLSNKAAELDSSYVADPNRWESKALARQLGRVHFCADSFAEAVRDNANFETLVEEYRIFDDAWHYLLSRAGQLGQYTPAMVTIGRDVWEIDSALADVLLIDPPTFSNEEAALHVVERFRDSSHRLEREIELANLRLRERGFSSWGLTQECDRLSRASDALHQSLELRSLPQSRNEFAELAESWRVVKQTANSTPRTRMPTGMTDFLSAMNRDFALIESSFANNYRWRYARNGR